MEVFVPVVIVKIVVKRRTLGATPAFLLFLFFASRLRDGIFSLEDACHIMAGPPQSWKDLNKGQV